MTSTKEQRGQAPKDMKERMAQIEQNYGIFKESLPELLEKCGGKWVLIAEGAVQSEAFDTRVDAKIYGDKMHGVSQYSVQLVEPLKRDVLGSWSFLSAFPAEASLSREF